jgi:hypothetical protein
MRIAKPVSTLLLLLAMTCSAAQGQESDQAPGHDRPPPRQMSEEDRAAMRERFENMSDEEKQAFREKMRERRSSQPRGGNLSEEERAARRAKWESMSEEQRAAAREMARQQRESKRQQPDESE